MTAAWFRSTSGGDNPPCHVVGHATAAQRYQAVARGTKKEFQQRRGERKNIPRAGARWVSLPPTP
jgi:hypothetical protein